MCTSNPLGISKVRCSIHSLLLSHRGRRGGGLGERRIVRPALATRGLRRRSGRSLRLRTYPNTHTHTHTHIHTRTHTHSLQHEESANWVDA